MDVTLEGTVKETILLFKKNAIRTIALQVLDISKLETLPKGEINTR